ncbi:hypothetical protein HRR94_001900 [Exophiala dermatitidis]|nr:hypothetical protein HRR79_003910 [Exophiala dermatitidis]KAJ9003394.1 hypothetical protein HRR94_001900 [Exophiala dermatitidis]
MQRFSTCGLRGRSQHQVGSIMLLITLASGHKMSQSVVTTDLASLSARSRRSSVSAIPRPTSGTSRHATPTSSRKGSAVVTPEANSQLAPRSQKKSWHPNDGAPPSSFHMPHSSSSSTDSLVPYEQRVKRDLSGRQQQLHIHKLSTYSLGGPEDMSFVSSAGQQGKLPRSKTTGNLLSSPRDSTPGRRLLQPLGPPLPRTQTLGSISCFSPPNLTPSPRKPTSVGVRQKDDNSKLNVADALLESRMTSEEMRTMVQVQREAAANRTRLRNSFGAPLQTSKPGTGRYEETQKTAATRVASPSKPKGPVNGDAGKPKGLRRSLPGRLLVIPAGSDVMYAESSPSTISSATGSDRSGEFFDDTKKVYSAESLHYWTGRYVSLCDRLRMKELPVAGGPLPVDTATTKPKSELLFETNEKIRMNTALIELRQSCVRQEALKSFEDFESQLLKKLGVTRLQLDRAASLVIGRKDPEKQAKLSHGGGTKPMTSFKLPQSPSNTSTATSRISNVNAEAVITTGPKALYGNAGLTKSKTTGNLAVLIPTGPKKQDGAVSTRSPGAKETCSHKRRTSYFERSPESLSNAARDGEEKVLRRGADAHRRSTSRLPSFVFPKSESQSKLLPSPKTDVGGQDPRCGGTIAKVNAFDPVVGPLDCAMLESGHSTPPPPVSDIASSRVQLVKVAGGGKEKLVKSRRKVDRQISGEIKSFIGAGMREVRKMGKRVGGINWGSSEDLLLPGNK